MMRLTTSGDNQMPRQPPDALLLMGTHCPWCPSVLASLQELHADGIIASLETVVIEEHPEVAAELGVRTVPWVRIGPFELEGMRSTAELREWAEKAFSEQGLGDWLDELLSSGQIKKVEQRIKQAPDTLAALITLFARSETGINTRIGISAIIEDLEDSELLQSQSDRLLELLGHKDANIRADACHFLSLTGLPTAQAAIKPLLEDADADVRSMAHDSLERLQGARLH
jgi:hypothetical protein